MIFNRTSGSTSPDNTTVTFTSTVTLAGATIHSVTTSTATAAAGTAASPPPLTVHREATVGVAVGVSLGLALLGSVAMLWRQRREAKGLREEKKNWEEKYIALLESKIETQKSENVPHHSSERLMRYELEDATIEEMPN